MTFPTALSPEKIRPICVITSFFTGIPALLARSALGFGLQTALVALLREACARWPPWSSSSKRSVLGVRPLSLFPSVSRLLEHCPMAVISGARRSAGEGGPAWDAALRVNGKTPHPFPVSLVCFSPIYEERYAAYRLQMTFRRLFLPSLKKW
jgi:hypothetical protein